MHHSNRKLGIKDVLACVLALGTNESVCGLATSGSIAELEKILRASVWARVREKASVSRGVDLQNALKNCVPSLSAASAISHVFSAPLRHCAPSIEINQLARKFTVRAAHVLCVHQRDSGVGRRMRRLS